MVVIVTQTGNIICVSIIVNELLQKIHNLLCPFCSPSFSFRTNKLNKNMEPATQHVDF